MLSEFLIRYGITYFNQKRYYKTVLLKFSKDMELSWHAEGAEGPAKTNGYSISSAQPTGNAFTRLMKMRRLIDALVVEATNNHTGA